VLVPEFYWQCIAFLCQDDDEGRRKPRGTAFFVSIPMKTGEVVFIVTAAHNIEFARANDRSLFLRLNRTDGAVEDIEIPDQDGWLESNETDLALRRFPLAQTGDYEFTRVEPGLIAGDSRVAAKRIAPGDEVFFCGLFSEHPGRSRSQPIVRWGNVSMMPGEKVRVATPGGGGRLIDAYLIEARSWGGQSGSPAFVFFPPDRELGFLDLPSWEEGDPGSGGRLIAGAYPMLLGVVQGHFDIQQDVSFKSEFNTGEAHVNVNAGIAVVIPAQKVIDILEIELGEPLRQ
jgi:hypothetical protein